MTPELLSNHAAAVPCYDIGIPSEVSAMPRVIHFEITADDPERAVKF